MTTPYAEELNFWQTSKSDPGKWLDAAKRQLKALGGTCKGEGFGSDGEGRAAFMLAFEIKGEKFKIIWPVMKSKSGNERGARVQAATSLYHYVKSVCLYAAVVGTRTAFFAHFMLPDGRTASEVSGYELSEMTPRLLLGKGE